jgi:hypothetical protein
MTNFARMWNNDNFFDVILLSIMIFIVVISLIVFVSLMVIMLNDCFNAWWKGKQKKMNEAETLENLQNISVKHSGCPEVVVRPSGVSEWAVWLIAILACFSGSLGGVWLHKAPDNQACVLSNQITAAQAQAQIESGKAATETQKTFREVQMRVIKTCVDRGMVPIITGSNVMCTSVSIGR